MSSITIKCDSCDSQEVITADKFDYEIVDSEERQMGAEITYEATVETSCENGHSIEVTHRYWEYPVGDRNHAEVEVSGGENIENTL